MRDDNCIFCKIANGEIPSATLYEDDIFVCSCLGPATKGHALILPKIISPIFLKYRKIWDAKAFILAKKFAKKMKDVFGVTA